MGTPCLADGDALVSTQTSAMGGYPSSRNPRTAFVKIKRRWK